MEYRPRARAQADPQPLDRWLRLCPLFADWPADRLRELASAASMKRYRRRAPLDVRGDREQDILMVASGSIDMNVTNAEGGKYTLAVLGPGQITRLLHLLGEVPQLFTAHAREASQIIHIPAAAMRRVLDAEPILWRGVARFALQRFHLNVESQRDWALGSVRRRMALVLINLAHRYGDLGSRGHPTDTELRITQSELASMLGVSRQTVAGEMRRLKAEGVVGSRAGYRLVILRDMNALLRIAQEP
ncbi:MAG: Crp/Fnr family transcriptional regulator [Burkholderiaceae bacterium]